MTERPDQWYQDALARKRRKAETREALQLLFAILCSLLFYGGIVVGALIVVGAAAKYIGLWSGF
jgi:hypothetical protein